MQIAHGVAFHTIVQCCHLGRRQRGHSVHRGNYGSAIRRIAVCIRKVRCRKREVLGSRKIALPEPDAGGHNSPIHHGVVGRGIVDTPAFINDPEYFIRLLSSLGHRNDCVETLAVWG